MQAYVGSFTTAKRKARGKGISLYHVDEATGAWTLIEVLETIANPGYVALDSRARFLYASHGDGTTVSAYARDAAKGKLKFLNEQPSHGDNGPHLMVAPGDRYVICANGPGIVVLPINADGSLAPATDAVVPPGKEGPYKREQGLGAHPHQVLFDPTGTFLISPDKGVDATHIYRFDAAAGKLVVNDPPHVKSRYGAGPRHLAFHPAHWVKPLAWLINELDSTVTTYQWDVTRGALTPVQIIPTTPPSFVNDNTGAEIAVAPSARFVYVSNRGHDSIATFAVDPVEGTLTPLGWESTQGKKPRFFTLDPAGEKLYVCNEDSDTIVAFEPDARTGLPVPTGVVIHTGSPSCIAFVK